MSTKTNKLDYVLSLKILFWGFLCKILKPGAFLKIKFENLSKSKCKIEILVLQCLNFVRMNQNIYHISKKIKHQRCQMWFCATALIFFYSKHS